MEETTILHGGEKELLELKNTLQEKSRYNAVLDSLDTAVEEQKEKIEKRKQEIEQEMNLEIKRRREEIAKPFYAEIATCEVEMERVKAEREQKRTELLEQMIQKETEIYERRLENLEKQIKLVGQEEGVPAICTSRLFLAFFCPRTGKDALILAGGLLFLLLILPMTLYFGAYGGNDSQALTTIYLVLIVFFYTIYLLINNLVKDKYLIGINKLLKLLDEKDKLEIHRKKKLKELENTPDTALDLKEFDEEISRLESVMAELNHEKDMALVNFDSNERLQIEIGSEVQERHQSELNQMNQVLEAATSEYDKMQTEYDKFLNEKNIEERYDQLIRMESGIFSIQVIDQLLFFMTHAGASNIKEAILMKKKKEGAGDTSAL